MTSGARRAIDWVLVDEGGMIEHPGDPGGLTNFGIARRAYPDEDIRAMTHERAALLYHRDYWSVIRGDEMPWPVAYALLDWSVNSGTGRAVREVQTILDVQADGKVGRQTLDAIRVRRPIELAARICGRRLCWLARLGRWDTFGRGWATRIGNVLARIT